MEFTPQISFRNVDSSEALLNAIQTRAMRLDRFHPRIVGCRVIVETPHRHHKKGKLYHVRVDLTLPGKELVVNRDRSRYGAHEDVYVAIKDAFDAATRQLDDYLQVRRGYVRQPQRTEPPPTEELEAI